MDQGRLRAAAVISGWDLTEKGAETGAESGEMQDPLSSLSNRLVPVAATAVLP